MKRDISLIFKQEKYLLLLEINLRHNGPKPASVGLQNWFSTFYRRLQQ